MILAFGYLMSINEHSMIFKCSQGFIILNIGNTLLNLIS